MNIFQQIWAGYSQNFLWMFLLFIGLWGLTILLYVLTYSIKNVVASMSSAISFAITTLVAKFYSSVFGLITIIALVAFIFK